MRSNRADDAIMSVKRILPWIKGDGHLLYNLLFSGFPLSLSHRRSET